MKVKILYLTYIMVTIHFHSLSAERLPEFSQKSVTVIPQSKTPGAHPAHNEEFSFRPLELPPPTYTRETSEDIKELQSPQSIVGEDGSPRHASKKNPARAESILQHLTGQRIVSTEKKALGIKTVTSYPDKRHRSYSDPLDLIPPISYQQAQEIHQQLRYPLDP